MSRSDRAEEIGVLRRAIAEIEGVPTLGPLAPRVRLGAEEGPAFSLDLAFGGGLPTGELYEVVPAAAHDMAAATGFALALAARFSRARTGAIFWFGLDFAAREFAGLYGPGLAAHGLDLDRLVFVHVASPRDLAWAMEEALKCRACAAIIGEFWSSRPPAELAPALRLLRAARSSAACGLVLLRQDIDFQYQIFSRLEVGARAAQPPHALRKPLPTCPTWDLRMLKTRPIAGQMGGLRPRYHPPDRLESAGSLLSRCVTFRCGSKTGGSRRVSGAERLIFRARCPLFLIPLAAYARAGNVHRLVAVNTAARRFGLAPGLTLAEARARHPALEALEHDSAAVATRLKALTAWCRRFTPLAACDAPDGIMLDIAGAAHLFGGEKAMIDEIETRLADQGLTARASVAATPEAAWALARFSPHRIAPTPIDAKSLARLVEPLPLAALRLDRKIISTLAQSGLRRIGDIALRPRAPLTARFGPSLFARLDALMGRTKSPISPLLEAPAYLIERRFAEGMTSRDGIEATIFVLAQDLATLLERHAEGARRLAVHLFRVDGLVKEIAIGTSRPLADPQAIARLFHERIEALCAVEGEEDQLDAGYGFDVLQLAAYAVEPLKRVQNDFEQGLGLADGDRETEVLLADLVDCLGARLGTKRVRRLVPNDTHIPERGMVAVPAVELNGSASPRDATLSQRGACCEASRVQGAPGHEEKCVRVAHESLLMP